ncbi:MAG: response regulator, partial [Desulfobacterales bacterium]|nr:response regulator [Desulfobacterales bacterium]
MEKVLLVDDDSIFLRIIEHEMRKYEGQFEVSLARNGVEAVEALKKEYVSVVVTDLMMPEMDGLELLAHVTRNYPRIPFIVITGCESDELKRWSDPRDKIQLLDKPVDFLNLARWIIEWLDHIDEGNFPPGISVGMALQLIRVQRKTCMLEISHHRKGEGWFYFYKGELNDAHYQDRQGEGAAVDMIGWGRVLLRFESLPNERKVRRIKRDFMELIPDKPDPGEDAPRDGETPGPDKSAETNEMLGEEGAAPEKSAEMELLSRAVLLAEQGRLESAREALARLLKMNPRNRAAWLWDSRIHHDIDAMETSLKKAAAIAPRDPMVVEEIRKFNLFKKKARGEPIRRCPFCWCAVEKMTPVCFYCRSHLYIHDGFFTSTRGGMRDVLEKAILKYERLVGGEVDFNAHYQFGMAWLNLEIWEEGLHQFYEAFRFAPGKNVVSGPLKTLLGFIASMENAPRENVYTRPVRSTMGGPPRRE